MRPNISITLITPHVTIERYSELTWLSMRTAVMQSGLQK